MEIRTTYIGTLNGVHGIWCGFKPKKAVIDEERLVLYPAEGYELRNIKTGEIVSAVWIQSVGQQDDWEEIEIQEI